MFRSGSTFQYNVACELVERYGRGMRLGFVVGWEYTADGGEQSDYVRVLKSHDGHESFATALREGRARAIYSFRDLRDVVFSLMHKFQVGFQEIIAPEGWLANCIRNDAFWTNLPNVFSQRYEDIIVQPEATVLGIARFIGLDITERQARLVAEEYSLSRNIARTQEISQKLREASIDLDDPVNSLARDDHTQLHWNHCRSGEVGTWKDLVTPEQRTALAEICGDWLINREYENDLDWAGMQSVDYQRA
jgi:hypothetical protein